jgi:hypothetical protein
MILWISAPMSFECPVSFDIKLGDIVWFFDVDSDMKVPMEVTKLYPNGEWDGAQVWTWGWA